jgi:hypothetical protein
MSVSTVPRIKLTGISPPARGAVLAELARTHRAPVWLVVAEDLKTAEHLAEDFAFFHFAPVIRDRAQPWFFPSRCPTRVTCAKRSPPPAIG